MSLADFQAPLLNNLLTQFQQKTTFQDYVKTWTEQEFNLQEELRKMLDMFDLDNATGERLDVIGAYVDAPRLGLLDGTYRKKIQSKIITVLASNGSAPAILDLAELWGAGPAVYLEFYPREFSVYVDSLASSDDRAILIEFLNLTRMGGVRWALHSTIGPGLICDSVINPLETSSILDSTVTPIAGAAELSVKDS